MKEDFEPIRGERGMLFRDFGRCQRRCGQARAILAAAIIRTRPTRVGTRSIAGGLKA